MSTHDGTSSPEWRTSVVAAAVSLAVGTGLLLGGPLAAVAEGKYAFPPIDFKERNRCSFKSSAMGQANAAREKLYDLRQCDMSGKSAETFDLSGVIASEADFSNVNFREAVLSKAYARKSKFDGADFTNAIVDRVAFDGASMRGVVFANALLTSSSFTDADLTNSDFTNAALGSFDLKNLCKNPTLTGENPVTGASTRESATCGPL